MIELRHLRYFIAVVEEGHFGRAAERLHMAQSPLSHQIRQLERQLGVVLIDRDHRVAGLTDAGRQFEHDARAILRAVDEAAQRARRAGRGEAGTIRIGFVPDLATGLLAEVVRRHRRAYPGVGVDPSPGVTAQILDEVAAGHLDVGFVRTPGPTAGLDYEELVREELLVALPAGHRLAGRTLHLADLAGEAIVATSAVSARGFEREVHAVLAGAALDDAVRVHATSPAAALLLVAAGDGVALVPAGVARSSDVPGVCFESLAEPATAGGGMCWRSEEPASLVVQLVHTARQASGPGGGR